MLRNHRYNRCYSYRLNRTCNFSIIKDSSDSINSFETKRPLIKSSSALFSKLKLNPINSNINSNQISNPTNAHSPSSASTNPSMASLLKRASAASLSSPIQQQQSQLINNNNNINKNTFSANNANVSNVKSASNPVVAASAAASHNFMSKILNDQRNKMNNNSFINNNTTPISSPSSSSPTVTTAPRQSASVLMSAAMSKLSSLAASSIPTTATTTINNNTKTATNVTGATASASIIDTSRYNDNINHQNIAHTTAQSQSPPQPTVNLNAKFSFGRPGAAAASSNNYVNNNNNNNNNNNIIRNSSFSNANQTVESNEWSSIMKGRRAADSNYTINNNNSTASTSPSSSSQQQQQQHSTVVIGLTVREALRKAKLNRDQAQQNDNGGYNSNTSNILNRDSAAVEELLSDDYNNNEDGREIRPNRYKGNNNTSNSSRFSGYNNTASNHRNQSSQHNNHPYKSNTASGSGGVYSKGSGFFSNKSTTNATAAMISSNNSEASGSSGGADIYNDILKSIHKSQQNNNTNNNTDTSNPDDDFTNNMNMLPPSTKNKKGYYSPVSGYGGGEEVEFYLPGVGIGVVELDEITDGESAYLRKQDHLNRTRAAFQAKLPPVGEPLPSSATSTSAANATTATVPWTSAMNNNNNNNSNNNYYNNNHSNANNNTNNASDNDSSAPPVAAAPRAYSIAELKQLTEQTLLQKKLALQQQELQRQQLQNRFNNNNNNNNNDSGYRSYNKFGNNNNNTTSNNNSNMGKTYNNGDGNNNNNTNAPKKFISFKQQKKINRKNQLLIANRTVIKDISIPFEGLTVRELSSKLSIKVSELKGRLEALGESCNMKAAVAADTNDNNNNNNNNNNNASDGYNNNTTTIKPKALSAVAMNLLLEEKLKSKVVDADVAELVALELGLNVTRLKPIANTAAASKLNHKQYANSSSSSASESATTAVAASAESRPVVLLPRAPIVCIMGHVDHGKTTLLDYLRSANVASGEAGGITQKLSAFSVTMKQSSSQSMQPEESDDTTDTDKNSKKEAELVEKKVVFLDTPGHAAFSAMRINGASATDVVVLVVAIDDGVRPQTIEAIEAAKESDCTIIIALNKVDKIMGTTERTAARSRVLSQLAALDVICEEFGGDVLVVEVSGRSGEGIDTLIETLALQTEVLDLKAPVSNCFAEATVLDACVEKGRGIIANVLVRWGSLTIGDSIVVSTAYGKIKALLDIDTGKPVTSVGPSTPVKLIGLRSVPLSGQELITVPNEGRAKDIADRRLRVYDLKKARMQENCLQALYGSTDGGSSSGESDTSVVPVTEHVSHRAMKPKKFGAVAEPVVPIIADTSSNTTIDDIALSLEKQYNNKINNNTAMMSANQKRMMNKVNVLLKADGPGTLSALEKVISELIALCAKDIQVTIINSSVGDIVQSDIERLSTVKGAETCILGFNIGVADSATRAMAKEYDIKLVRNTIIYRLEDELRSIMESLLPRECSLVKMGEGRVKQVFAMTGKSEGVIAGLMVEQGYLKLNSSSGSSGSGSGGDKSGENKSDRSGGENKSDRNNEKEKSSNEKLNGGGSSGGGTQYIYRVLRNGSVVSGGERLEATTLKRYKESVNSVEVGSECGLTIEKFKAYEVNDVIECYKVEWRQRTLTTTTSATANTTATTNTTSSTPNNNNASSSPLSNTATTSNNSTSRNNNNSSTNNRTDGNSIQQKQQKIGQ